MHPHIKYKNSSSITSSSSLPTHHLTPLCVTLFSHFVYSEVGPISTGCGGQPAAGGPLNGFSHHEGGGGCHMGGVEHRGLHLWLHSHQRHGGAHPQAGERHHHPPVRDWFIVCWCLGAFHLHPHEEAVKACAVACWSSKWRVWSPTWWKRQRREIYAPYFYQRWGSNTRVGTLSVFPQHCRNWWIFLLKASTTS